MHQRQRMGDLLRRMVPLSWHDVDEILQEQRISSRRFGETAIAMGLCRPEHVWRAWCGQNPDKIESVDLDQIGVDAQAVALIPRDIAMRLNVIPIRVAGDLLVVATSDQNTSDAATALATIVVKQKIRFVIAPAEQIKIALMAYYPA